MVTSRYKRLSHTPESGIYPQLRRMVKRLHVKKRFRQPYLQLAPLTVGNIITGDWLSLHRYLDLPEDLSRPPSLRAVSSLPFGCSSIGYSSCDWTEVSLSRIWAIAVGRHHTCCLSASFIAENLTAPIGAERNAAHHTRNVVMCWVCSFQCTFGISSLLSIYGLYLLPHTETYPYISEGSLHTQ